MAVMQFADFVEHKRYMKNSPENRYSMFIMHFQECIFVTKIGIIKLLIKFDQLSFCHHFNIQKQIQFND